VGEPLGWAAPVCDPQANTYVSDYDGGLVRVDPEGRVGRKPYFRSRRKFDSGAIIHDGILYVGAEDGYVFAIRLDPDRGKNLWNHAAEQGYTGGYVNSSPAVTEEGLLVVAARDEILYGFLPSGATAWKTRMPGIMLGSPVIDRYGHIYVGVSQAQRGRQARGLLVCVDGNSHKIRWEHAASGPVESTPVIGDDDTVYFGDNSGTIHALDNRGNVQWTAKVEAAVRSAGTILAPKRLAFGLDDDTLVVVKCSSKGLAQAGWPKIGCTPAQAGMAPPGTGVYGEHAAKPGDEKVKETETDEVQTKDAQQADERPQEGQPQDEPTQGESPKGEQPRDEHSRDNLPAKDDV
jgi:outer membrane protein assembly factor BamB